MGYIFGPKRAIFEHFGTKKLQLFFHMHENNPGQAAPVLDGEKIRYDIVSYSQRVQGGILQQEPKTQKHALPGRERQPTKWYLLNASAISPLRDKVSRTGFNFLLVRIKRGSWHVQTCPWSGTMGTKSPQHA